MSAANIQAGKAFVEITAQDKTTKVLTRIEKKLQAWGRSLLQAGAAISAAAGGVLGTLTAMAQVGANIGGALNDMASRTGVSADVLSSLGYAAEQSGLSLEDLAGGLRNMARFSMQLARGSQQAGDILKLLKIDAQAFLAATPPQKLEMVADALRQIADPSLRSALAMQILGRSADQLMPLLAEGSVGMRRLQQRAHDLGLVLSDEQAQTLDELDDAWNDVRKTWQSISVSVALALGEALTSIWQSLANLLATISQFVRDNGALVFGLAAAAAAAAGTGAALTALGGLALAGAVAVKGLGIVIGLLSSPLVAVSGLLVAGTAAWMMFTATGQHAADMIGESLAVLYQNTVSVLKGIQDALAAGNWGLAAEIAMTAMKIAWQAGLNWLNEKFQTFRFGIVKMMAEAVARLVEIVMSGVQWLVEVINQGLELLGLSGLDTSGLSEISASVREAVDQFKAGADMARDEILAGGQKRLQQLQQKMGQLMAQAATEREAIELKKRQERERKAALPTLPEIPGAEQGVSQTLGAFSAAVKGLLAFSADSPEQRTAANTERIKELMQQLVKNTEDLNEVAP